MPYPSSWQQFKRIFYFGIKSDWIEKERGFSFLFFSLSILLLITMALESTQQNYLTESKLAVQIFLTIFLGIQVVLLRSFDIEKSGGGFSLMQSYPLNPLAWYFAKVIHIWLEVCFIFVPTVCLAFLMAKKGYAISLTNMFLIGTIISFGLVIIGVLLSALVLSASGREVLFPVLYFPLAIPILLAGIESTLCFADESLAEQGWQWLGLALGFDVIYATLGALLFGEIVDLSGSD